MCSEKEIPSRVYTQPVEELAKEGEMFFKKGSAKFCLVFLFLIILALAACASGSVSLVTSLAERPEDYEGKMVMVYGWLVEKVEEESRFVYEPYYGYCPTGKIEICFHFVEKKTCTWIFLDGEGSNIRVVIEEKATSMIPLHVVPVFASSYGPEVMVLLTGEWRKSGDGYILFVEKINSLDEN